MIFFFRISTEWFSSLLCFADKYSEQVFVCSLVLGVVLISLALCADAVIGNVQEKAMKLHNGSNSEMVNTRFAILKEHVLS